MTARALAVFMVAAVVGGRPLSAQESSSAQVGDHLFIRMTGVLAKEYAQLSGPTTGE